MTHVRTQIRHRIKQALDDELPQNYRVFASRKYPRSVVAGQPIVDMRISNDETLDQETQGTDRDHEASLFIRVQRNGLEESIDDLLDTDEVLVVKALQTVLWGDLLEDQEVLEPNNVSFDDNAQGNEVVSSIIIEFKIIFRIDFTDPETAKE